MFTNLSFIPSETVLVVGNGAISNGWQPVITAYERAGGIGELQLDPAEPFSYLVYQLRVLARRAQLDRSVEQLFRQRFDFLNRLRLEIARAFKEAMASGEIGLKVPRNPELSSVLDAGGVSIVTTNWDTLLHRRFGSFPILSLHGWVEDPNTLYLPTEITFEPYRSFDDAHARKLSEAHRIAIELLRRARTVVLWGISLNMYDAEICVLLGDSHQLGPRPEKRYVVLNPCKLPVRRLGFLTGAGGIEHVLPDGERCTRSCCAGQLRSGAA